MKRLKEMRKNKMFSSQYSELSNWEKVENLCICIQLNIKKLVFIGFSKKFGVLSGQFFFSCF